MAAPLQFEGLDRATLPVGPVHLAIGMFDGVHLGHRATLQPAIAAARHEHGCAAVLTFWPHPSALFRPDDPTRLVQSPAIKAEMLGAVGVDVVITQPFTREFAQLAADAFLPWLRERLPSLRAVYIGENFRFGHRRAGDVALLRTQGAQLGIAVNSASALVVDGEGVSSTRIRSHLVAGEIAAANALLGYAYFAEGVVTAGKRLGRQLGFATLNVPWAPDLRPRFGVYAVRVHGHRSRSSLPGIANYGLRPTVENTAEPKLEVHVLGACPYGAGDAVRVEWLHFLRPEQKFSGIDALREQIATDRSAAEQWFASGARSG